MIFNYLKIAFRNLLRYRVYTAINILGLAIGITCSTFLFLYVQNELDFDRFHSKSDRIYRIVEIDKKSDGDYWYYGQTAPALAPTMAAEFPEIESFTRVFRRAGHIDILWKGERILQRNFLVGEANFFETFDFNFIYGNGSALNDPNSLVLTESAAKRYFGDQNPIGEIMVYEDLDPMQVTGVIEDVPENSHLQFELIISENTAYTNWSEYLNEWNRYGAYSYLVLGNSKQLEAVENKKSEFIDLHWGESKRVKDFYLQSLEDIYFESDQVEFAITTLHGNKFYIRLFVAIAIFILIIAAINYMNLATAKTAHRAKEIGLRKVNGATRSSLIFQFLVEAVLVSLISFILSIGLIEFILPHFNDLSGKQFTLGLHNLPHILSILLVITTLIGLTSGSYPALYLSSLKPIDCFKGKSKSSPGSQFLRQGLVVIQFAISIIMTVATLVVYNQLDFIRQKPLGFEKENMMVIDINQRKISENFRTMKSELAAIPGVEGVATSSRVPGEWKNIRETFIKTSKSSMDSLETNYMGFDEDMLDVYNIKLVEGRNFEGNRKIDSTKVMINLAAAKALGLENPVGKNISIMGMDIPVKVIGLLEDFHYQSLHNNVAPLVIGCWKNNLQRLNYFSLKISDPNLSNVIDEASRIHEKFDAVTPLEYHFLDSQLNKFYKNDQLAGNLFGIGAFLMVFVASLGLFGLTSFMMEKRKKEIAVRKVLGASISQLYFLLTRTYAHQVLIAFLVAAPLGWYASQEWLNYFAYNFALSPMIFVGAGFIALTIALTTVSYRVFQASVANPAETLKDE